MQKDKLYALDWCIDVTIPNEKQTNKKEKKEKAKTSFIVLGIILVKFLYISN